MSVVFWLFGVFGQVHSYKMRFWLLACFSVDSIGLVLVLVLRSCLAFLSCVLVLRSCLAFLSCVLVLRSCLAFRDKLSQAGADALPYTQGRMVVDIV